VVGVTYTVIGMDQGLLNTPLSYVAFRGVTQVVDLTLSLILAATRGKRIIMVMKIGDVAFRRRHSGEESKLFNYTDIVGF
jgi:hypothetical protein